MQSRSFLHPGNKSQRLTSQEVNLEKLERTGNTFCNLLILYPAFSRGFIFSVHLWLDNTLWIYLFTKEKVKQTDKRSFKTTNVIIMAKNTVVIIMCNLFQFPVVQKIEVFMMTLVNNKNVQL